MVLMVNTDERGALAVLAPAHGCLGVETLLTPLTVIIIIIIQCALWIFLQLLHQYSLSLEQQQERNSDCPEQVRLSHFFGTKSEKNNKFRSDIATPATIRVRPLTRATEGTQRQGRLSQPLLEHMHGSIEDTSY